MDTGTELVPSCFDSDFGRASASQITSEYVLVLKLGVTQIKKTY